MRALVIHPGSDYSVADVHRGYCKGLRDLGVDVAEYNLNDRLVFYANCVVGGKRIDGEHIVRHAASGIHGKIWEWWPDLIVVISGFYVMPITWQILHDRPHRTAIVFTESPYEDDRQLDLVEKADPDVVILNDPVNLEKYRAVHKHVEYLPHCYDPDIHHPSSEAPSLDFSFVGTGYPSRIDLFEQVDWTGIDAVFAGNWQGITPDGPLAPLLMSAPDDCLENERAADLYRWSRMSANVYRGKDPIEANHPSLRNGWSVGPREIELAACQTPFLREPRGEGDLLFPMLPTFTEPEEFEEKLRWWLAHPEQREKAAIAARTAIEDRTFDENARRLLKLVDQT